MDILCADYQALLISLTITDKQIQRLEMDSISWEAFQAVEMRVGRIVDVQDFTGANKPAFKVWADFGPGYGILKSSAQITDLYNREELIGTEIIGVLNIPPKPVG